MAKAAEAPPHLLTLHCSSFEHETDDGAVSPVTRWLSGVVRDWTDVRRATFGVVHTQTSSSLITVGSLEPLGDFRYDVNVYNFTNKGVELANRGRHCGVV